MHAQNCLGCYKNKCADGSGHSERHKRIDVCAKQQRHSFEIDFWGKWRTFGFRNFMSLQKAHMKVMRREWMSLEWPAPGITPCSVVASNLRHFQCQSQAKAGMCKG